MLSKFYHPFLSLPHTSAHTYTHTHTHTHTHTQTRMHANTNMLENKVKNGKIREGDIEGKEYLLQVCLTHKMYVKYFRCLVYTYKF